ncbi:MAG TPA: NAD-dependent epimerase/dehydratase family protein [Fastidiosipila sp.]|nr:NAD-dependent epimerase/dehydratase family protein [Fastidiosipila sp.]
MKRKYLITGATGHLGNHVIRELLENSGDVRALVLPDDPGQARLPSSVEIVHGDVLDVESLERFFTVASDTEIVVIHMAAIITIKWGFDQKVHDVNVEGTRNVVSQCIHANVKKLIHVSSVHAIPELPHGQIIKEVVSFSKKDIVGFYGKTKAQASQIVMDAVAQTGLNATILFPAGIVGPGDYRRGFFTTLIEQAAKGNIPAGVKGAYNFVDVRDAARGIVAAVDKGRNGESYILANRRIDLNELFYGISVESGAKEVKKRVPMWIARLALPFISLAAGIRKQKPLFTLYSLYTLGSNSLFSSDKAIDELGYSVRPFSESIHDTIEWMRNEGWLTERKKVRARRRKAVKQPLI